jgi:hypothetical protein
VNHQHLAFQSFKEDTDLLAIKLILRAHKKLGAGWFTPVIVATQETEIRIMVQSHPGQIGCENLSQKNLKRADGVGVEFKPQYPPPCTHKGT